MADYVGDRGWDALDAEELRAALKRSSEDLERWKRSFRGGLTFQPPGDADLEGALAQAVQVLLAANAATLGECRVQAPYMPIRPVIDAQGKFRWCCGHSPDEHCAP
jgi:hypothetical protein